MAPEATPIVVYVKLLQALRAAGVRLAVVTNKEGRYARNVLDAHRLAPLFERVVTGDTLPVKKPNAAGIVDCLQHFNVPRQRALFVGDSSIDVAAARNAGIPVWVVSYGYNRGRPVEDCNPDRVIAHFSNLMGLLTTDMNARST